MLVVQVAVEAVAAHQVLVAPDEPALLEALASHPSNVAVRRMYRLDPVAIEALREVGGDDFVAAAIEAEHALGAEELRV